MSGTSADGMDAALVEIGGDHRERPRLRQLGFVSPALPATLRAQLLALPAGTPGDLCRLNVEVGQVFADAVLALLEATNLSRDEVQLIGSHGQTICHLPPGDGGLGATLQIGEPAVIAERTGLPVIANFRVADMAAGGHGAPLIPLVDQLLFAPLRGARVLLNLGGIGNLTLVTPSVDDLVAFDTGPANMPLDLVAASQSAGRARCDVGGAGAARGQVDESLLAELLAHPFVAQPPPRSTGRESFGESFVAPLCERFAGRLDDLLATLVRFCVECVATSIERFVAARCRVDEVLVSGGGVKNPTLMAALKTRLAPMPVRPLSVLGVDPDAKEALGFALLADRTLFGAHGNLPAATGARGRRVLGTITLAPG